jgi:hypothetical protein
MSEQSIACMNNALLYSELHAITREALDNERPRRALDLI